MRIILLVALCIFSLGADAKIFKQMERSEPLSPQQAKEIEIRTFNTEVSRNLIHLAHANWNDEAVEGHSTPEFYKNYTSGEFLKYVPYGQLMSFEGVYDVSQDSRGKTIARAFAAFELKKVDVEIVYEYVAGRFLIDAITITPIEPNNQTLDQVLC